MRSSDQSPSILLPGSIIQHHDCFEVRSEDGSIVRKFVFDDDALARDFEQDDQETSLPSRQEFCRQEIYSRGGEAVTIWNFAGVSNTAVGQRRCAIELPHNDIVLQSHFAAASMKRLSK